MNQSKSERNETPTEKLKARIEELEREVRNFKRQLKEAKELAEMWERDACNLNARMGGQERPY